MLYSDYQVHVMGHVPYVGFATYRRATVRTRFTFCIYIYKKKKGSSHITIDQINALGSIGHSIKPSIMSSSIDHLIVSRSIRLMHED
jgi:hypothetical protein